MSDLIIDASLALAWGFQDEADSYAESVLRALPARQAVVPTIWPLEVANALAMGERRKRLSQADATRFLSLLRALPIRIEPTSLASAFDDLLPLARQHRLTVYDAAYLELAMRHQLPLATLDDALLKAATSNGVESFTI